MVPANGTLHYTSDTEEKNDIAILILNFRSIMTTLERVDTTRQTIAPETDAIMTILRPLKHTAESKQYPWKDAWTIMRTIHGDASVSPVDTFTDKCKDDVRRRVERFITYNSVSRPPSLIEPATKLRDPGELSAWDHSDEEGLSRPSPASRPKQYRSDSQTSLRSTKVWAKMKSLRRPSISSRSGSRAP